MTAVLLVFLQAELPVKLASKHYDLRSSATKEQAQELLDFMDLAHATYTELLESSDSARAKRLEIRLYKDRDEYLQSGGPDSSGAFFDGKRLAGYWDPDLMKACFAHEGVHQLVQLDSRVVSAFPEWFHEGFADCLADFELRDGKLATCTGKGAIARMRIPLLQQAMKEGRIWKLSDFLKFGPKKFDEGSPLSYAVAWSFCRFLMKGEYRSRLLNYYQLLRAGGIMADKAWARVFKDVSFDELEREWRKHVAGLE